MAGVLARAGAHVVVAARRADACAETVAGIAPITPAQEGIAYRVRTVGDRYAIVRIVSVQPATYNDLLAGGTAQVEFEWDWESD